MKLHGYCVKCRKIKRVNVLPHMLAHLSVRATPMGTCDACMEAKR